MDPGCKSPGRKILTAQKLADGNWEKLFRKYAKLYST